MSPVDLLIFECERLRAELAEATKLINEQEARLEAQGKTMKILDVHNSARAEHVALAKRVAAPYLEKDDPVNAWIAFVSAMRANTETADTIELSIGTVWVSQSSKITTEEMEKYIGGFL